MTRTWSDERPPSKVSVDSPELSKKAPALMRVICLGIEMLPMPDPLKASGGITPPGRLARPLTSARLGVFIRKPAPTLWRLVAWVRSKDVICAHPLNAFAGMEVTHDGTTSVTSDGRALQAKLPLVSTQSQAPQEARLKMGCPGLR